MKLAPVQHLRPVLAATSLLTFAACRSPNPADTGTCAEIPTRPLPATSGCPQHRSLTETTAVAADTRLQTT